MKNISFDEFSNLYIGNAQDTVGATGVTAIVCPDGAVCGLDVRGGGPASRESFLPNPLSAAKVVHSVVLCGGSAFGLDCAGGVMQYLEQHSVGFDTGAAIVPLVCTSALYDLSVGSSTARPDAQMGYQACKAAFERQEFKTGNFGAGTGATVGKLYGARSMMKSGLGACAVQSGDVQIGAVVAVNAFGDIYHNGKVIAGLLNDEQNGCLNTAELMYDDLSPRDNLFTPNTVIGAVITNAKFDKAQMNKIAAMAHNGYARAINPVNTTADGDSVYALSVGSQTADLDTVGTLAAEVMQRAIVNAVLSATPAYGLKCARDIISDLEA